MPQNPTNPTLPHTIETDRLMLFRPRFDFHEQIIALYKANPKGANRTELPRILKESKLFAHVRQAAQERQSGKAHMWYIALKADTKTKIGDVIGCIRCDDVRPIDNDGFSTIMRGFIDDDYKGQGYFREAIATVTALLKEKNIRLAAKPRLGYDPSKTLLGDKETLHGEKIGDLLTPLVLSQGLTH